MITENYNWAYELGLLHGYKRNRTIDEAFKPNGITDNRDAWRYKNIVRKIIAGEPIDIKP